MIWPLVPYSYNTMVKKLPSPAPSPPTWQNPLGTDDQARDVLARVIYGFRLSVLFGFALTIVSSAVGIAAGAVQGYYGGLTDLLFQRFIEIWNGMPQLYLLIILASIITPGFWVLLIFLLLFSWMNLTGVVRAEFLRGRNLDYVRAARALGVSDIAMMWRHILPNAMVATLTFLPFTLSGSVTILASLDFLGFGLPPGSPSLGELVAQGEEQPAGAVAGVHRVLRARRCADVADLHRRGGARFVRSAAVAGMMLGFRLASPSRWCPSTFDRSPSWPGPPSSWPCPPSSWPGLTRPSAAKRRGVPRVADGRVKRHHDGGGHCRNLFGHCV